MSVSLRSSVQRVPVFCIQCHSFVGQDAEPNVRTFAQCGPGQDPAAEVHGLGDSWWQVSSNVRVDRWQWWTCQSEDPNLGLHPIETWRLVGFHIFRFAFVIMSSSSRTYKLFLFSIQNEFSAHFAGIIINLNILTICVL